MHNVMEIVGNIAYQFANLKVKDIIFSPDVVKACEKNSCGRYNKRWTCPPAVGNIDTLRSKYSHYDNAVVYTTKHDIEDSFDIEGMFAAQAEHMKIDHQILRAIRGQDIVLLGSGSCNICKNCTYPNSECRHANIAVPSVEAVGIDVVDMAAKCGINYHNGVNTVTYFSVIFHNSREQCIE